MFLFDQLELALFYLLLLLNHFLPDLVVALLDVPVLLLLVPQTVERLLEVIARVPDDVSDLLFLVVRLP